MTDGYNYVIQAVLHLAQIKNLVSLKDLLQQCNYLITGASKLLEKIQPKNNDDEELAKRKMSLQEKEFELKKQDSERNFELQCKKQDLKAEESKKTFV